MILIACLLTWPRYQWVYAFSSEARTLWLGTAAGALGALFSTGIAMRKRSILTDLQLRENRADAVVRIGIGATAGVLLVGMFQAEIVSFSLGDRPIGEDGEQGWLIMALLGFVAGFSERLVPDLLDKSAAAAVKDRGNPLAGSTPQARSPAPASAPGETDPLGRAVSGETIAAEDGSLSKGGEEELDGCLADDEVAEEDAIDDSQLPAATGGLEEPGLQVVRAG